MLSTWRRRFTTLRPLSPDASMEFWPTHKDRRTRRHGSDVYPDVFMLDPRQGQALVVEAKRGRMPKTEDLVSQLLKEGLAAHDAYPNLKIHLLLVTDEPAAPPALDEVRRLRPRLYASRVRHTSRAELCDFLREWRARRDCDAGHRRMIDDALAVMAKYGR